MWPGPAPGEALGPEVPGTEGSEARFIPRPTAPGRTKETRSVQVKWGPKGPQRTRAHGEAGASDTRTITDYSTHKSDKILYTNVTPGVHAKDTPREWAP